MEKNTIIVTTDFSADAKHGYPVAAQIAKQMGASLILVHVAESPSEFLLRHGVGAAVGIERAPYLESLDGRLREQAMDPAFSGMTIEPVVLDGSATAQEQIDRLARDRHAALVVAASSGHSAVGRWLLGSFTEKLIRLSSVPVLTARGSAEGEWKPSRVVVPIDFSANSKSVFPEVRRLWEAFHPTFLFVYVLDSEAPLLEVPPPMGIGFAASLYEETPGRAREAFRNLKENDLEGVVAEFTVLHGRHYREIRKYAEENDADLILVATHGWTGIDHLVMGSVAERVAREAPCSVITVRPPRTPVAEIQAPGDVAATQ